MTQIFISYSRTDEKFAHLVHNHLRSWGYKTWIDIENIAKGAIWTDEVDTGLRSSDIVVGIISPDSVASRNVKNEWDWALINKRPLLLLLFKESYIPMNYISINYINFSQNMTTGFSDLKKSLASYMLPSEAVKDFKPTSEGQSEHIFIERLCDKVALQQIRLSGITLVIKGSDYRGKTVLIQKVAQTAMSLGKSVISVDLLLFSNIASLEAARFFKQFCMIIGLYFKLDADVIEESWQNSLGDARACTHFMETAILPLAQNSNVVLIIDKCELLFDVSFGSEFFGMLRAWHNQRASSKIWSLLDIVITTKFEPHIFLDRVDMSPFNVGQQVELTEFERAEIEELNRRSGYPLESEKLVQFIDLVGGNPYLIQQGLYYILQDFLSVDELFDRALSDIGPFGGHLRSILHQVQRQQALTAGLQAVLAGQDLSELKTFFLLKGIGVIDKSESHEKPNFTCRLYEQYFRRELPSKPTQ